MLNTKISRLMEIKIFKAITVISFGKLLKSWFKLELQGVKITVNKQVNKAQFY